MIIYTYILSDYKRWYYTYPYICTHKYINYYSKNTLKNIKMVASREECLRDKDERQNFLFFFVYFLCVE